MLVTIIIIIIVIIIIIISSSSSSSSSSSISSSSSSSSSYFIIDSEWSKPLTHCIVEPNLTKIRCDATFYNPIGLKTVIECFNIVHTFFPTLPSVMKECMFPVPQGSIVCLYWNHVACAGYLRP